MIVASLCDAILSTAYITYWLDAIHPLMGARQSSALPSSSSTAAIMTRIASLPHVVGFEPGSHARGTHDLDTPSYAALRYLRHACPSLDHVPTDLLLIIVQFTIGTLLSTSCHGSDRSHS